jgi:D-sedoheptulose 7-phosphate isomerase
VRSTTRPGRLETRVDELLDVRTAANERFFAEQSGRVAALCHCMAERFGLGGRLLALGSSPQGRSDARHVAVEFVHPVIVGKRALPAIGLTQEGGELPLQVDLLAEHADMVIAFGDPRNAELVRSVAAARSRGCLTAAFAPLEAEWEFAPATNDPFVAQELVETLYHVLWELVHVFLDRRRSSSAAAGAAAFLYPFLHDDAHDGQDVIDDVERSVLMKSDEVAALREQTLTDGRGELVAAASSIREALERGCRLLAFGNGGSATDAMDVVADFRTAPQGWPARAAIDLTEDSAVLTALANDIGPDVLFSRQIIAHGKPGDVALALSTSGDSNNVVEGLVEARQRGLHTIAMVGYEGGRVAADRLADQVIVSRSEHIPRIQEAQASAYHVLRELVELTGD